ncbi:DeoR/GlpR family DNA-binding transcription regulator [Streptomyces hirsutus]|uniref:DeoR/GlpR family DNA-binding transcription regulator n=1 Tax=Streptomyces hirsutus TaxID=35620 RepID=UPI003666E92A
MSKAEVRHGRLREILGDGGFMSTYELARAAGVSEVTLRRDLRLLEQMGVVVREHGGARLAAGRLEAAERFATRELRNPDAKTAIGRRASELVGPGEHIAFNDGTTVMQVANALLAAGTRVTVTTNALNVAMNLSEGSDIDVYVLGGLVRRASFGTYLPAQGALAGQRFDTAILGIESMDENGIALDHAFDIDIARAMIDRSQRVIVVADGSKCERRGRLELTGWEEIDVLITDFCPDHLVGPLRRAGVEVLLTPGKDEQL